jgi:hypothetical protein
MSMEERGLVDKKSSELSPSRDTHEEVEPTRVLARTGLMALEAVR